MNSSDFKTPAPSQQFHPLPEIMGSRITRAEVIEGLREIYRDLVAAIKVKDPTFVRYPDMEVILDHLEEHGLEPK